MNIPLNRAPVELRLDRLPHFSDKLTESDLSQAQLAAGCARKIQEILHEQFHLFGAARDELKATCGLRIEAVRLSSQEIGETGDMPQWRPQIVRNRIRECFKLFVCGLELGGPVLDAKF